VAVGDDVDSERIGVGTAVRVLGGGLGHTRPGTWAGHVAVTARAATPVPDGLELSLAAACGSVAAAARAAIVEVGGLQPGERVSVTGASGAVGSLAAQLAVLAGAASVVAWTRSPERAALLPPAVEIAASDDAVEPVDLLVDTVGGTPLARRLESVRPGGRAVLVGYTAGVDVRLSIPHLLAGDVALLPLNMMRRRLPKGVEADLLAEFATGGLRLAVETVSPAEIESAIERLARGEVSGRLVLSW
jgi:NADPH:quinone reductase-like Zn-dependent oxidoreductase